MKVIDAFWGKRNLDVSAKEVIVEDSDTIEAVLETLLKLDAEYQVMRVPTGRPELYKVLGEYNFFFIEAMLHVSYDFSKTPLILKDHESNVNYAKINSQENLDTILSFIKNGMFNTDRISLDPKFSFEQAANRYCGMIKDKLNQGAEIYNITKEHQNIGFFLIYKDKDEIYNCSLTGLFPPYQGKGLGSNVVTQMLRCVKEKGEQQFISHVSTNNRMSFELHIKRGFQSSKMEYLFVKHR